jgi:hypothetical protein
MRSGNLFEEASLRAKEAGTVDKVIIRKKLTNLLVFETYQMIMNYIKKCLYVKIFEKGVMA